MTIRLRLALALALAGALAGVALLTYTTHAHRESAIAQARDAALGVHQITLAGLTGMMISGAADRRGLFLDQIERVNNIRALRVVRGSTVNKQYGPGGPSEQPTDPMEDHVIATGKPVFEVRQDADGEFLKAIMPAIASHDSLGKNCLGCHYVAEGTVLGAVTLEVSLARVNASIADFRREVAAAGLVLLTALGMLAYLGAARGVSQPLGALTRNLRSIAAGHVDLGSRLRAHGNDEITDAVHAFNAVLEKTQVMVREERIAADVFEHASEGILVTDRDGRIIKVNPAFTRTTGYSADEAIGKNPRILQSGQHDEGFYREFWERLTTAGSWQGDIWNRRKNGEVYPEWLNINCVRDERGEIQNYVAVFSDITERKRHELLMAHQAHHDGLTGLPNRVLFRDRLVQAMAAARRNQEGLAVMFLDLDHFKRVNDTHGHDAGDELLKQVAQRIRGAVRGSDTVARISGDEFTVMLPQIRDESGALAVAEKILDAARQPYRLASATVEVTTSIGISVFPKDGDDPETLMRAADAAMYEVKSLGRSGCAAYRAAATAA